MAISNEIFETFRMQEKAKQINKAINLIIEHGYTVLDLENKIIDRNTIKKYEVPKQ